MKYEGKYKGEAFSVQIETAVDAAGQPYAICDYWGVLAVGGTKDSALAYAKALLEKRVGCGLALVPLCGTFAGVDRNRFSLASGDYCVSCGRSQKEHTKQRPPTRFALLYRAEADE